MNELLEFCLDTENSQKNYNLGVWYEKQNHTGPAHTYYLRAAERTEDKILAYKSLIRSALCLRKQSSRDVTEKSLLKSAVSYLPERPEAYYFLSNFHEKKKEWEDSYTYSCLGLSCYNKEIKDIEIPEYPGKYSLIFQRAVSSWWWGKGKESRELFHSLVDDYWNELDKPHKKAVEENLVKIGEDFKFSKKTKKFNYPENFDWGDLSYDDIITIEREVVEEEVYRFWNDVKEGDTVLDIGASVGAYTISILDQKPKEVYCVEPSKNFVDILKTNCKKIDNTSTNIICINSAIVSDSSDSVNVFGNDKSFIPISFGELIGKYNIPHIDFMKIDCEGGEYSIFTDDNIDFLVNSVNFIAMEIHLKGNGFREKFKNLRDNYLHKFKEYKLMSCTRQNISWGNSLDLTDRIFDNDFIDEYNCELMLYIKNNSKEYETNIEVIDGEVWEINNLISTKKSSKLTGHNKFPPVYCITLKDSIDRQNKFKEQFNKYGIEEINFIEAYDGRKTNFCLYNNIVDSVHPEYNNSGAVAAAISHLKAIKYWYDTSNNRYAIFFEDDVSIESIENWNFSWNEFIDILPKDWKSIQLSLIKSSITTNDTKLNLRDCNNNWSAGSYLITREYAKELIEHFLINNKYFLEIKNNKDTIPVVEHCLFSLSSNNVYTIPLFYEDVNFNSTFYPNFIKNTHKENQIESSNYIKYWWKIKGIEYPIDYFKI